MKVYIHNHDSFVGRALYDAIKRLSASPLEDDASIKDVASARQPNASTSEVGPDGQGAETPTPEPFPAQPSEPAQAQDPAEPSETELDPEPASIVIYSLSESSQSIQDALSALDRQRQAKTEQTFIAITTPLTWARTQVIASAAAPAMQSAVQPAQAETASRTPSPVLVQTEADAQQVTDMQLPAEVQQQVESATAADAQPSAAQPLPALTSAHADTRRAAACARNILQAERIILAASNKLLKTYVICPGILYGNGETDSGLHAIFKAAWEAKPDVSVPLYGPGHNILPTMHIADLAAYVAAVCLEPPAQQYLLATDGLRLTQREIVTAIAQRFGETPVKELAMEELYFQQGIEHMLVNLPFAMTPLSSAPELQYPDGLIAHLDSAVQQYIQMRGLQPLRLLLTGPPAVGKSTLAARLAQHYQLQLVSAKSILAAANDLGGSVKQEVQAELSSKIGRVSDGNMAKLCSHLMGRRDVRMRGFLLEGWPKTADQAELLFMQDQPYTPEERQRLEALRGAQAGIAAAAAAAPVKGKPAKPDPKGKAPVKPDLPKRLKPLLDMFPTHVIHMDVAESTLLPRCLALGEQEQAAARAAAAAADPKSAAAPAKGKGREAGPMTHNNEKDFKRRYAAYKAIHDGDAASLKALQAAEQLWWDDKKAVLEAAATAEAEAAAAASAKTMRLTALASMKSMGPGSFAATMKASSRGGSTFLPRSRTNTTGEEGGSRKGTPPVQGPAAAALAAHLRQGPPHLEHGGLVGLLAQHHAQVVMLDAAQSAVDLATAVTTAVGAPHNYSAHDAAAVSNPPANAAVGAASPSPVPPGDAKTQDAAVPAAEAAQQPKMTAEQAAAQEYVQRCRAETVAMRAEPLKQYMMQQLMPVLAKAMADATTDQPAQPVPYIANKLAEAGKVLDLQYSDPYAAQIYAVQQQKWDAKNTRDAEQAAQKAARDATVVVQ